MQIAMDVSPYGVHLVAEFEELRLVAYQKRYKGGLDKWTIGYGHTGPEVHGRMTCTTEQALKWLHDDLAIAVAAINRYVTVQLNQNQFDALTSFVFNVGSGENGFKGSTLLKLLNEGRTIAVATEFPKWDHVDGVEEKGLLRRRLIERDLFLAKVQPN